MQTFALDERGILRSVEQAERQKNYLCPECKTHVRLRGGFSTRLHFFHLHKKRFCRQRGKSPLHLAIQHYFLDRLPKNEAILECPFPSHSRIADIAWHAQKIIFEIQCSPISPEEMETRRKDYAECGYTLIWILHDRCFNKKWLKPAENYLRAHIHYFTNLNQEGKGSIYDQISISKNRYRLSRSCPLSIDFTKPMPLQGPLVYHPMLQERSASWTLCFSGDWLQRSQQELPSLLPIHHAKEPLFLSWIKKISLATRYLIQQWKEEG